MSDTPDFIAMSEYLGELRGEVAKMPYSVRPLGQAILEALTKARDRMMADQADLDHLRALIRRSHDAMSRREPDGVSDADWDQLVSDMAKEVGL